MTAQKIKFTIKDFFSKFLPQFPAYLDTYTEELLLENFTFLYSKSYLGSARVHLFSFNSVLVQKGKCKGKGNN